MTESEPSAPVNAGGRRAGRSLPSSVDRTEVYRPPEGGSLWVGGQNAEWHFPGFLFDLRSEDEEPSYGFRRDVAFERTRDNGFRPEPEIIDSLVEEIALLLAEKKNVLVRCSSGIERSPAVAVAYLVRKRGMTAAEAYAMIRAVRPQVREEFDLLVCPTHEEKGDVPAVERDEKRPGAAP